MIGVIIGLAGSIGSGKSFTQLREALNYANERQKQLVCNFNINVKHLFKYAKMTKLFWIQQLCLTGGIIQIPSPKYLEALLIPESVVCLDEAGILLNSREFAKTSKELLADLAQSRKDGCDLFWAAQFEEQVDKQLRLLTQYWIHCDSLSAYDKQSRRPKLVFKNFIWFKAADYMQWIGNPKDRSSYIKARFSYGFKSQSGFLTQSDKQLFKVFDSFSRLDRVGSGAKIITRQRCILPKDYYFGRNETKIVEEEKLDKNKLIFQAIALVRQSKIVNAPYFKALTEEQIEDWIKQNKAA